MKYDVAVFMKKYNLTKIEIAEILKCTLPTVSIMMQRKEMSLAYLERLEEYEELLKKYDDQFETFNLIKSIKYNEFKFYDFNRPLNHSHVRFLEQSITQNNLLHYFPILIFIENEIKYIVDGQHRFQACVNLKIPFYYRVIDKFTFSISHINSASRSWNLMDYVLFFVAKKNENYANLKSLMDKYNITKVYTVISLIEMVKKEQITPKVLKSGKFVFTQEQLEESVKIHDSILHPFTYMIKNIYIKDFIVAIRNLYNRKELDIGEIEKRFKAEDWDYFFKKGNDFITVLKTYKRNKNIQEAVKCI
ncbi:MAG: hypothetical protein JXB50_16985 [Spirochaetes bacterium]|nr:hypothetical protein [Spirochaetota bacterium]